MALQSTLPHKSSHATDGTDALTPAEIGAATAAQGVKADTALQPTPVNYLGEYNNEVSYNLNAVVKFNGQLYIRVEYQWVNGYAPGDSAWELFEPEIGSPAYDLWVQTALAGKAELVHEHFQPWPEYAADSVANAEVSGFDGKPSTIFLRESGNVYRGTPTAANPAGDEYSIFLDDGFWYRDGLWVLLKQGGELVSVSTNATTYPWEATWTNGVIVRKAALPRLRGKHLAPWADEGGSAYAARADHVHPLPTLADIGAAAEDHSHPLPTPADIGAAKTADVQIFRTTSSTWIKPAGAKICEFQCIGGGGGGGCGAKVSASTAVYGGLGGSSGGHSRILISASELNDAEYTVTVGAGGNGAIFGVSAALAGGASFVAGVNDGRIAGVTANGIASNGGVSVPANTYGGIPNGNISGAASINATAGQGGNLNYSPPAGGAGGGCGSSNSQYSGGASSNVYLSLTGAGGTVGGGHGGNQPAKSGQTSLLFNGTGGGGGGGASTSNTNGGNGANATGYGCGGGGGGSCSNASPTLVGGNGGNGGNGVVVIITYF